MTSMLIASLLLASTPLAFQDPAPKLREVPAAEIDALFSDVDRVDRPGCSLAIVRAGEVIYARG
ncbi:MAG: hypothetical protein KDB61_09220, partial [Planctomycetes bacterium]|nr:hypothetical protein [Planctomycetota bacterium]